MSFTKNWVIKASSVMLSTITLGVALGSIASAHARPATHHVAAKKSGNAVFVEYASHKPFGATIAALKHAVAQNGMMVLGTLNQAGALSTTGLHLKGAESFFVGNPVTGKSMFQMNPAVGTDVPVRVFVWVNAHGATDMGYFQPSALLRAVNPALVKSGMMLNQKLAMIVKSVATGPALPVPRVHVMAFEHRTSARSFSATVAALKHAVAHNGMMVLGTLNQAGALSTTGLHLKGAESFFVGNPVVGKSLFQMNPAVGGEVPMRVYVWVNPQGKTELGYFQPSTLMGAISASLAKSGVMMNQKLAMIVKQAAQ